MNEVQTSAQGRVAIRELLRTVHEINRRPLPVQARELAGAM